jgi:PAS domain S-box-containing protein
MAEAPETRQQLLAEVLELRERVACLEANRQRGGVAVDGEEALRQSHDELRAIYDGMFDGLLILDFETKRLVRANGAICRMLGYPEAELLSMSLRDLFPADDAAIILKRLDAYFRGEFPGHRISRLVRKDGSIFYADSVGNPLMYHGRKAIAGFFQDITERRQAEAALRDSEERVRTICDSALDAMIMVDSQGTTLYWNPAAERMFGYSCDEMLGREVHTILPSDEYRQQALRGFAQFSATGGGSAVGRILELIALRKDGTVFPIEMAVSSFRMLGQWCAVAIIRDVTDRIRAREALERERRTLKHMLRASDHERQLIAYDIHDGLAQHLAGAIMQFDAFDHLKEAKPKQAADAFHAGMTMLRQGHFEARRLISGVRPPILDESGVVAAIAHLVSDLRFPGGPKIEFRSRVTFDRLIPLLENAIYRIVQEALTNACKHAQSALVRISMLQRGERLRAEIRDWGVGFDLKATRENRFGLEGIRERARVLGGKSRVRSSLGSGTSVVVELPVVERDLQQ